MDKGFKLARHSPEAQPMADGQGEAAWGSKGPRIRVKNLAPPLFQINLEKNHFLLNKRSLLKNFHEIFGLRTFYE